MTGKPRYWLVAVLVVWSLVRLAIGVGTAAADSPPSAYHPRSNHIGVVVTGHEVFVSWLKPAGATSTTIVVRRGQPACPRTPAQGTAIPQDSPVHVIDQSVTPGGSYCYTVFLKEADGTVTTVGTTGLVSIPSVGTVPPVHVAAPPAITAASSSSFDSRLAKRAGLLAAAALAAALLLFAVVRSARRAADDRVVMRPTMRESIVGRNTSALVVPTMIALGWIVVVIGFVILR
jgi:hypothetical protein